MVVTVKQSRATTVPVVRDEGRPEQRGQTGVYSGFGGAFEGEPTIQTGPLLYRYFDPVLWEEVYVYGNPATQGGPYGGPEETPKEEGGGV